MTNGKCLLLVFCCALTGVLAHGQTLEKADTARQLDEVTVTAQTEREMVPRQRLSGRRLEALSSFSVADAIRYFSGVQVKDYGGVGGLKTVDIRSMGTNHMGVFYDGIQLGNAQNGQIDLGKFSMDNMEEISLYNGQKSSIFQSAKDYGSSGTIYLRSRQPRFEGKRDNLRLTFRTGSFGLASGSALWEHRFSDALNLSLNAEYTYATGRYHFRYRKVLADGSVAWDTTAVRKNGDLHALRLEGGLNGTLRPHGSSHGGKWNAKLYFYDSERGIPGAIVNNVWKRSQRQWDRNFFAQGHYQEAYGERYELMANVKYAHDYMHYLNPDTTLMLIDNEFRQQEVYFSTVHLFHLAETDGAGTGHLKWDASLSLDYQWNWLDATLKDFVHPRRNTYLAALATTLDWWRFRLLASALYTYVDERVTRIDHSGGSELLPGAESGTPDNYKALTPSVFLSVDPLRGSRDLQVYGFYKRIFRMPTFNDLYYTDIGNVYLKPEYTDQFNLGIAYQHLFPKGALSRLQLKADAYYNEVENKIIAVPKGTGQYRWMMLNIGYVEIRGLEFNADLQFRLGKAWRLGTHLGYTYQKAQDFSDPTDNESYGGTYGGQIAYIPWHSASLTANLTWKSWGLNYSFIYVGERYHTSANIPANHEEPWYTHDLNLTKDLQWGRHRLTVAAECNNVLNQQYDVVLNYPMPGRNYKLIVKYLF